MNEDMLNVFLNRHSVRSYTGEKIRQLSVAEMFAEAITRIDEEVSISSLF